MRLARTLLVMAISVALSACVTTTPVEVSNPDPMAAFTRMTAGEWRVVYEGRSAQYDTWSWGPGQHSIRNETFGSGGDGEPWRELQVYYWHPGRQEVRLLGLLPHGWGVAIGTMEFEGNAALATYELYREGRVRELSMRWEFDGSDKYRETLVEDDTMVLAEWDYVRSKTRTPAGPYAPFAAPGPSGSLSALEWLVGYTWVAERGPDEVMGTRTQSTFEWVPYADAIYVRSASVSALGVATPLMDTYIYFNAVESSLHCLALEASGGVREGRVTVLEGGTIQFDMTGYDEDGEISHVTRFDLEDDGRLRVRTWTLDGDERTLAFDARHSRKR